MWEDCIIDLFVPAHSYLQQRSISVETWTTVSQTHLLGDYDEKGELTTARYSRNYSSLSLLTFFIFYLSFVYVYVFTDDIWYWRSENTRTHIHTIKAFHFKFIIWGFTKIWLQTWFEIFSSSQIYPFSLLALSHSHWLLWEPIVSPQSHWAGFIPLWTEIDWKVLESGTQTPIVVTAWTGKAMLTAVADPNLNA